MGTITDKLNKLAETKSAIKTAIVNKGVAVSDTDTFASYANKIASIEGGSSGLPDIVYIESRLQECPDINPDAKYPIIFSLDDSNYPQFTNRTITLNTTELVTLFRYIKNPTYQITPAGDLTLVLPNATKISYLLCHSAVSEYSSTHPFNLTIVGSSNLKSLNSLFHSCKLDNSTIHLTLMNTHNVTNFGHMFYSKNSYFTDAPLFDTQSGTNFSYMFYDCAGLINVPSYNTSNGTNFSYMFYNDSLIRELPELDTSKGTDLSSMLYGCNSIKRINGLSLKSLSRNISNSYFTGYNTITALRYALLKDLGTGSGCTSASFTYWKVWGIEDETVPLSAGARQSLIDTLITYSYDRATAGYSTCTVELHANTKALLTQDEIAQMTAKGYTLA